MKTASAKPSVSEATVGETIALLWTCARPYQWVKNLFVLAALMFSGKLGDGWAVGRTLAALADFCLLSSAIYILNDVIDAPTDRAHPEKCGRPIASGRLSSKWALLSASGLAIVGLVGATAVDRWLLLIAVCYLVLMVGYCLLLKHVVILDAMVIAVGFMLRLWAGAVAVGVTPTHWLMLCAFLLALFLAFSKRRQELFVKSKSVTDHRKVLAHYSPAFLDQVITVLIAAAIVCYALYTVAPETVNRFGTDQLIYGNIFVIYGMLRYLMLLQEPANGQDPSRLLIRDKHLIFTLLGWAAYNGLIIYRGSIVGILKTLG